MVCCNCDRRKGKRSGWYGDAKGEPGTFFKCGCLCHKNKGKYPHKLQQAYEKKNPETNPKVKNFPEWFEKDKLKKIAEAEEAKRSR